MYRKKIAEHIPAFEELLQHVRPDKISTELYCQNYLRHLLEHKRYFLNVYADCLEKLLLHTASPREQITLIDYGAGNGLLGLFAKYCGFKKVFINDRDEKFVSASVTLSVLLGIPLDGFIAGEIAEVKNYFSHEKPDAIVGTDVIEHIYDLSSFFSSLTEINAEMVSVFTTASNPCNYFKVKQLQKLQRRDELEGGTPGDFLLFGSESHEPYLIIREKLIREADMDLSEDVIIELAVRTRGLNKTDILKAVHHFSSTGRLPAPVVHPSNTCNPLTGSWTERILSIEEYQKIYEQANFTLVIYNGFYDNYKKGLKAVLNGLLNKSIFIFGKRMAPFLVLAGTKKA